MDYPHGIDLSHWNPGWNPAVSASRGVKFVGIRRSVGNYYRDGVFPEYYAKAKAFDMAVMSYHVINPSLTVKSQMDWAFESLEGFNVNKFVLDVELHKGESSYKITDSVYGCVQECIGYGYTPIIYTSAGFWNYYVHRKSFWKNYPLWVANYTSASTPCMPWDWQEVGWKMWQYSADGNYLGAHYGVDSRHIDLNHFNGTLADMYTFFGKDVVIDPDPPVDPEPPTDPDQDYIKAYLWKTISRLNIRTMPTTVSGVVRTLPENTIVEEVERVESGNDLWVRIGNNQYCALEYKGRNYLSPIYEEN